MNQTVNLEGGCRISDMRVGEPLAKGSLRIWNQIGRATGAQAISLRVMEFATGLSPGIRNADCDEILYVLNGRWASTRTDLNDVSARDLSNGVNLLINGSSCAVGPDTGIYVRPGETFAIDNPRTESVILVSSQCPDPDRPQTFDTPTTEAKSDSSPSNHSPIVRLSDRPAQPTAARWYRVLVDGEVGSTQVTQFVGSIPPGRAPDHFHNYEEVLFILKGEGRMWAGESNTPITSGSCIYLPKGQVHCVENTGTDELRLLGVFYPAGSPAERYDV